MLSALLNLLLACTGPDPVGPGVEDSAAPWVLPHPFVAVRAEDREPIRALLYRDPYRDLYFRVLERAARPYVEDAEGDWDHEANGQNASTAEAAAFLAWLGEDADQAAIAIDFLERLETDFENNQEWDVNIRMPTPLIAYTSAWDLLLGGGFLTEEQDQRYADKIATITDDFFQEYIDDEAMRLQLLAYTQNNHPLRTAAAVGVPGLAFRDRRPEAQEWLDWAASETSWLLSEQGQYIQPDGAVSEGPFYFGFGLGAVLAFTIAMDNALPDGSPLTWDCRNRVDQDPWTREGCVEGAEMAWQNPLREPWFQRSLVWSLSNRLPDGLRPPTADGYFVQQNGGALVGAAILADPDALDELVAEVPGLTWDWADCGYSPYDTTRSFDLTLPTLARVSPEQIAAAARPAWTSTFRYDGGEAVLRGGWESDDLWLLFLAEHGSVRKTVHDHVDSLSFSLFAYGDYLLMDPGYYKPSELDNAVTADADSHNVILVDGQGAPDKGLMFNWGDTDAWLGATFAEGAPDANLAYAEASQNYEDVDFVRGLLMVRDRYAIVLDRTDSEREARTFSWRLSGNSGYDAGKVFALSELGARWEHHSGGVDLSLASTRPDLVLAEPAMVEGQAPHVHQFDLERAVGEHGVLDGSVLAQAPGFVGVLAPYQVEGDHPSTGTMHIERLELGPGIAAITIDAVRVGGPIDLALVREADAPTAFEIPGFGLVETDARALFFGAFEEGAMAQLLASGGSHLRLDGVSLGEVDAQGLIAWVSSD